MYADTKKMSAIIRNNRKYLLENIQPHDEFINLLLHLKCLTEEQRHLIQRQYSTRHKNVELLHIMRSVDINEQLLSKFVTCLLQTNQKTVAGVVKDGGSMELRSLLIA